jgi:hypothetical protein
MNNILKDSTDHDVINCDHYLEQVFNCQKMRFMEVPQRLQHLLQQPDPLVIHHVIKWDGGINSSNNTSSSNGENGNKNSECYDVNLECKFIILIILKFGRLMWNWMIQ